MKLPDDETAFGFIHRCATYEVHRFSILAMQKDQINNKHQHSTWKETMNWKKKGKYSILDTVAALSIKLTTKETDRQTVPQSGLIFNFKKARHIPLGKKQFILIHLVRLWLIFYKMCPNEFNNRTTYYLWKSNSLFLFNIKGAKRKCKDFIFFSNLCGLV